MDKLFSILHNSGKTIKMGSQFCFLFFLFIAIGFFILGSLHILIAVSNAREFGETLSSIFYDFFDVSIFELLFDGGEIYKEVFSGNIMCVISFLSFITSLLSIPMYGYGSIIDDVAIIKDSYVKRQIEVLAGESKQESLEGE